jgi:transcriptional regulator with GAF, ATPase, and Fis domain
VLQEGSYERVGEGRPRRADVRLIAATNRELLHEVAAGRFRQDLYYRLAVYPIAVPPLRARKDDLPLLAAHLLARICRSLHRPLLPLTPEQLALLAAHDWPGNVRELRNVLERAVISAGQGDAQLRLALDEERPARRPIPMFAPPAAVPALEGLPVTAAPVEPGVLSAAEMRRRDRQNLLAAVASCHGKIYGPDGAAALLGMKPTTLASRLKRLHG